jgi:hypothetical protein
MLSYRRRFFIGASLLIAVGTAPVSAQILNSERIEQTFGSYGIDVVYSDESLRLSNLYSEHGGERITRTLAFVEYPEIVNLAFAAEHRAILEGGSIGSTFKAAGWEVIKKNLSIIEVSAPDVFADLMGVEEGAQLATHYYQLDVARDEQQLAYALIAELHHPDYLSNDELTSIYPLDLVPLTADSFELVPDREEILRRHLRLLHAGRQQFRDLGLSLSQ